ncbi:hypothetical protein ACLOJK_019171, partial [Asimina triloba]
MEIPISLPTPILGAKIMVVNNDSNENPLPPTVLPMEEEVSNPLPPLASASVTSCHPMVVLQEATSSEAALISREEF